MASIFRAHSKKSSPQQSPIQTAKSKDSIVKNASRPLIDVIANNWSRKIDLKLLEIVIYGNGNKEMQIAGRTDQMWKAQKFYEDSKGKLHTDSRFHTTVSFKDRFIIEVVASKEDPGIAGGFEPMERFMRWHPNASHEEIEQLKEWNKDYITRRNEFLTQNNVFKGYIKDITEPVNVMIDVHEASKETPTDHILVTAVSRKTEKVVAQLLIPLTNMNSI